MRDILLVIALIGGLGLTIRYPFVGVLLWTWFTCASPHREAYGFAKTLPLNLAIAVVTILSLAASRERKFPPREATFGLLVAFLVWMTFVSFFAVTPAWSWPYWDRTWRIIALAVLVGATATNKVRIQAIIWVIVMSLVYYGFKGGVFTILSGGHYTVYGPADTNISDNNQLALALLMTLPLMNYLRLQTKSLWVQIGLWASLVTTTVAVLGSYSRGAYLAIAGLAVLAWWRSRNKLLYPVLVAIVVIPALFFMPQSFYDRLYSIQNADADASFQGRVVAWKVAFLSAVDRFPLGDGFAGAQLPRVFNHYFPDETTHAAHSIYFEVLGDQGFIGFAIYMSIVALLFWNCYKVMQAARDRPDLFWARDLAAMIQLSLLVFCIGGAALSMAYYDMFILYVGLVPALRQLTVARAASARALAESAELAPPTGTLGLASD